MKLLMPFLLGALACAGSASAATINVPAGQATIQAAINAANNGDTVLVAPGTYYGLIDFKGKAITLKSSGGAAVTILDGNNNAPIVTFANGESNSSVLQGFTLTHAKPTAPMYGSAVHISGASPMILDNIFSHNTAWNGYWGAAIGGGGSGSPVILRNYFTHNSCPSEMSLSVVGIVDPESAVIADNVFVNNPCTAVWAVLQSSGPVKIYNNTMVGNRGGLDIEKTFNSTMSISNNLIAFNQYGVDILLYYDPVVPNWSNNLVYGNTIADYEGIPSQTGTNGNISSEPRLKYRVGGNVHLLSGSPAIDSGDGTVAQASATDFYGNTRAFGGTVDIGAAESITSDSAAGVGAIIHVPADQPTIQGAINAAAEGDVVKVAAGTYYEQLDFKGKTITVEGHGAADTILDGNNGAPLVTFDTQESADSVLQGFTLTHAKANVLLPGSAVALSDSSPTIQDNIFAYNITTGFANGAAIGGNNASPLIARNFFGENSCSGVFFSGIVAFVNDSSPTIVDNVFLHNLAGVSACPAINVDSVLETPAYVYNNTIVGNPIGIYTHAFADFGDSTPRIYRNNLLYGNGVGYEVDNGGSFNPTWQYNLVYGSTTADYQGVTDPTGSGGNISSDPKLKGAADGDIHLLYGSPAIDAGDMSEPVFPSTDFFGHIRVFPGNPGGSAIVDIGAAEYGAPVITALDGAISFPVTDGKGVLTASGADSTEPLVFAVVTQPAHGFVTITETAAGTYKYTSAQGYVGSDSFTFHVTDPYGGVSNTATESLTVTDVAPVANPGSAQTTPDNPVTATLEATRGYAAQKLSFAVVSGPAHGKVSINSPTGLFVYTPATGFAGADSFTFQAKDAVGTVSNAATESVAVNDVAANAYGTLIRVRRQQAFKGFLSAPAAYSGQVLHYQLVAAAQHGTVVLTDASKGAFNYTPDRGYIGKDSFSFKVVDQYGTPSNTAVISLAIF
jgi:hypothetical protein